MCAELSNRAYQQPENPSKQEVDGKKSNLASAAQKSARGKKSAAAFRTISEVADSLAVQQHVLRFWETKFSQVKPLKRGGGRRYYRPEDVKLLQSIHRLLYTEGYTIKGVQKLLREVGKKRIIEKFADDSGVSEVQTGQSQENIKSQSSNNSSLNDKQRRELEDILAELKELRGMVKPKNQ